MLIVNLIHRLPYFWLVALLEAFCLSCKDTRREKEGKTAKMTRPLQEALNTLTTDLELFIDGFAHWQCKMRVGCHHQ